LHPRCAVLRLLQGQAEVGQVAGEPRESLVDAQLRLGRVEARGKNLRTRVEGIDLGRQRWRQL